MVSEKRKSQIMVAIFIAVVIGIVLYFIFVRGQPKPFLEIDTLYNEQGVEIQRGFFASVVGGIEGVKFVTLRINVENKDKVPLNLQVTKMTPTEVDITKPTQKIKINPGQTGTWVTGKIDITSYEGIVQTFCATVESDEIFILRGVREIDGCIDIEIKPSVFPEDEEEEGASFEIEVDSSVGDSGINPSCEEDWGCTIWTDCSNSIQTRMCSDFNECGTEQNKPIETRICQETTTCQESWTCGNWGNCNNGVETRTCTDNNFCGTFEEKPIISRSCSDPTPPEEDPSIPENPNFETNAIDGEYATSTIWIKINGLQYFTNPTRSSLNCDNFGMTTFMVTPEGYAVCTRIGFPITERVYIDVPGLNIGSVLFKR